jgi:excisionase family DNA binding protein
VKSTEGHAAVVYLTPPEMAELLRTTPAAIYVMKARGQLPGVVKVGRRVLFHRQTVLDWLDRKTAPSPQELR